MKATMCICQTLGVSMAALQLSSGEMPQRPVLGHECNVVPGFLKRISSESAPFPLRATYLTSYSSLPSCGLCYLPVSFAYIAKLCG